MNNLAFQNFKIPLIALVLLFLLFFNNRFDVYEDFKVDYKNHYQILNTVPTSWIVGSILKTREDGLFSRGPFTIRFLVKDKKNFVEKCAYQRDLFLAGQAVDKSGSWQVYKSAIRWPVHLCSIIDTLYFKLFGEYTNSIFITRTIFDFFTSICLLLLMLWAYWEFGWIGFLSALWLSLFFPILNFSTILGLEPIFLYILPFSILLLKYQKQNEKNLFWTIFLLICLQQMVQYEKTPIVFVSIFLPLVYYAISQNWSKEKILKHAKITTFSSLAAIAVVVIIHFGSLVFYFGIEESSKWFTGKLIQRTYSELESTGIGTAHKITEANHTGILEVLTKFYVSPKLWFGINALGYFFITLGTTIGFYFWSKYNKQLIFKQLLALSLSALLSYFSVLAYFVIFKSQAAAHDFPLSFFQFPFFFLSFFMVSLFCLFGLKTLFNIIKATG